MAYLYTYIYLHLADSIFDWHKPSGVVDPRWSDQRFGCRDGTISPGEFTRTSTTSQEEPTSRKEKIIDVACVIKIFEQVELPRGFPCRIKKRWCHSRETLSKFCFSCERNIGFYVGRKCYFNQNCHHLVTMIDCWTYTFFLEVHYSSEKFPWQLVDLT